jgi:carbon-monoxide dehydrogenase small subunit
MKFNAEINGKHVELDISANTLLVDLIRENLHLTGTHVGCDSSQCGACTVLVDNLSIKSCNVLAMQISGKKIKTIESVENDVKYSQLQSSFNQHHGLQCGFCTPGMIMGSIELLEKYNNPNEDTIREQLDGNICRCTGYQNIVQSIKKFSEKL